MKRFAIFALALLASMQAPAQVTGPGNVSYQGLWYSAPAESQVGWGINIAHQGPVLFATWFTYDTDGSGLWLVMPDARFQVDVGADNPYGYGGMSSLPTYTGTIYRTAGPAFDATSFDPAKVTSQALGSATFTFTSPSDGIFTYSLKGTTRNLPITREIFGPATVCVIGGEAPATPNFTDLWYNAPAESEPGWGVNITQQGDLLFATWFTYDAAGMPMWIVMPRGEAAGFQAWSGPIYHTTGPPFDGPWDNAKVVPTLVGTASFSFADANSGTFTATMAGETIRKSITREVFMSPASNCR